MKKIAILTLAGLMLTGCYATTGKVSKQNVSTGLGCVAGGVLGSKVGSGSGKTLATITGTIAGCKVGSEVGKNIEQN